MKARPSPLQITTQPWLVQTAYDETIQGYFKKPVRYSALKEQIKLIIAYWTECIHPDNNL